MSEILLKPGWRTDNSFWRNIAPEAKAPIAEFVNIMQFYKLGNGNGTQIIEPWLKQSLRQFFDQRYNAVIPRYGYKAFWDHIDEFGTVTNRLIMRDYCNPGGTDIVVAMQLAVNRAILRYNDLCCYNFELGR